MKKTKYLLLALLLPFAAMAQPATLTPTGSGLAISNNEPMPSVQPASFVGSIESYFTSHDSTLTPFVTDRLFAWTGVEYVSGVTTANIVGIDYDIWKASTLTDAASQYKLTLATSNSPTVSGITLGAGAIIRNEGVAGTIMTAEAGGEVSYVMGTDTKITGFVNGGYQLITHKGFLDIGARLLKALSTHTYAGLGISVRSDVITKPPTGTVLAGASF